MKRSEGSLNLSEPPSYLVRVRVRVRVRLRLRLRVRGRDRVRAKVPFRVRGVEGRAEQVGRGLGLG